MDVVYVYGTPKAIYEALKNKNEIEAKIKELHPNLVIKYCPEHMVYMNMLDPNWTEQKCDEILYITKSKY